MEIKLQKPRKYYTSEDRKIMNRKYYNNPKNKEKIKEKARERYYKNREAILAARKAKQRIMKYLTDAALKEISVKSFK